MLSKAMEIALVACLMLSSFQLHAQDSTIVGPAARLRVRVDPASGWHYGSFAGVAGDTLLLGVRRSPTVERIQLSSRTRVEVSVHDAAKQRSNEVLGLILGAAAGAVAVHLSVRECELKHPHSDGPPCALGYTAVPFAALAGAGVGAIVGRVWPANRWRPASIVGPRNP